jgi:hypothetical protein
MLLEIADRGVGVPPAVDPNSEDKQVAYFTNEYGKQRIYVFDLLTYKAVLYVSENWEMIIPIDVHPCSNCEHMTKGERIWIQACTEISKAIIESRE